MDIAVTGSSGLIGTALCRHLTEGGHRVVRLVRRPPRPGEDAVRWDPAAGEIDAASLEGIDAAVHLAGAGIGDKRWTDERRRVLIESRTDGTSLLARTLAGLDRRPAVFLSASGAGYYGDGGDTVLTEESPSGDIFLSEICRLWEGAAAPAVEAGIRTAYLRTTLVLAPDGGALGKLLPLFRVGLGGRMGGGREFWSWITLLDEVRAIEFLLDHDIAGPVNMAAPGPVRNAEVARALGRALHRPAAIPVPSFGPRLLLGRQLADELLFISQRVEPGVLDKHGFAFEHADIDTALRWVVGSS
jgi:uncharacterized protein (TIGR01777 family)